MLFKKVVKMPVKLQIALREGWKATENKRFGDVFEIRFIDVKTDKIMFRYAPKLEDEQIFTELFKILRAYDVKLTELMLLVSKVENKEIVCQGDGFVCV
jgi:hypothetical protein